MPVIKKYSNRRMYDTEASRYVNLDDVAAMVREGTDVQIVDAKTGEDLTRLVLTQIIVEGTKNKDYVLPVDILRQMIMVSSKAQQDLLSRYFSFVFGLYDKAQSEVRERVGGGRPFMNPFDAFQRLMGSPNGEQPPRDEEPGHEPAVSADTAEELARLRERLEELEARLTK